MKKGNLPLLFFAVTLFFIALFQPECVSASVTKTSQFFVRVLLPSLFPVSVACNCLMRAGLRFPRFGRLFTEEKYRPAIFLGSCAGFPVGAVLIRDLADPGADISAQLCMATNAGIGFVVSALGGRLLSDTRFGVFLFVTQMIFSFFLSRLFFRKSGDGKISKATVIPLSQVLTSSVLASAQALFKAYAFLLFYGILTEAIVTLIPLPTVMQAFLTGIFEFSGGCALASELPFLPLRYVLCGFFVGFGGLCVHSQVFSAAEGLGYSRKKYLFFKLSHGFSLALAAYVYGYVIF